MIRKGDIQWWVLEAKKHPESAPTIIEELAKRLTELDGEVSSEPSVVFLSNRLKSACLPLSQVQRLTREGRPVLGRQAMLAVRCLLLAFAELPAFVRDVYVMVDELAPGRLLHSLKSGLSGSY